VGSGLRPLAFVPKTLLVAGGDFILWNKKNTGSKSLFFDVRVEIGLFIDTVRTIKEQDASYANQIAKSLKSSIQKKSMQRTNLITKVNHTPR
jgi:hypothetical protein